MSVHRLTGPNDPRVVDYRDIAEHELVRSRGLFVAEGRLLVGGPTRARASYRHQVKGSSGD